MVRAMIRCMGPARSDRAGVRDRAIGAGSLRRNTNSLRRNLPGEQQWDAELVGKGLADQHRHGLRAHDVCGHHWELRDC